MKILLFVFLAFLAVSLISEYWMIVVPLILIAAIGLAVFSFYRSKKEVEADEAERAAIHAQSEQFKSTLNAIPRCPIELSGAQLTRHTVKSFPELRYSTVTSRTDTDRFPTFVVIDTETTGLRFASDHIIELSAIRFEHFQPVACWTTLINPGGYIPPEATAINHITDEMVEDAPTLAEVAQSFAAFVGDSALVGYNLPFDLKFLWVPGVDIFTEKRKYYDVLPLARSVLHGVLPNYKLTTVADSFRITVSDAHRSLSDCYATGLVFEHCINMLRIGSNQ